MRKIQKNNKHVTKSIINMTNELKLRKFQKIFFDSTPKQLVIHPEKMVVPII